MKRQSTLDRFGAAGSPSLAAMPIGTPFRDRDRSPSIRTNERGGATALRRSNAKGLDGGKRTPFACSNYSVTVLLVLQGALLAVPGPYASRPSSRTSHASKRPNPYREMMHGDLHAQLGATRKGRVRLVELLAEYGNDDLMRYVEEMISYADRRMAEEIRAIPDGTYTAQGWMDAYKLRADIPVHVAVTVSDDRVTVDFTGTASQAANGINGSLATSTAAAAIPFLCDVDPDIPHNHGCISHIDAIIPKGTICNAEYPGSTSAATSTPSDLLQDVIHRAMATAVPEKVLAGSCRVSNIPFLSGIDPETGEPWATVFFNGAGGGPACKETDGWPLYIAPAAAGGQKFSQVEQLELLQPLRVIQLEIEPDSMGLGEWIGGPGVRLVLAPTNGDVEVITFGDGAANPPHGVLGGTMGIGGGQYIENSDTGQRRYVSHRADRWY